MYSQQHYNILLAHMLKTPAVRDQAIQHLEPRFFTDQAVGGTAIQAVLFEVISDYYKKFKQSPDPAVLFVETDAIIKRLFPEHAIARHKADVISFSKLINIVEANSAELAKKLIHHIHKQCVIKPTLAEAGEQLKSGDGSTGDLMKRLAELERQEMSVIGTEVPDNVLTMPLSENGQRIPTGIPFLDSRLGNGRGPVTGCAVGILSPQGGGKTTLGLQLAVSQALMDKPALLCLAEEGLTMPLRRNLVACTTGIPTFELEADMDKIHVTAQRLQMNVELVMSKVDLVNKNLRVLDMVENGSGMFDDVELMWNNLADKGMAPTYTYVDWAGCLAERMLSLGYRGRKFDKKFDALATLASLVERLASKTNSQVCIAQQMAADAHRKGPYALNDHYCAMDCRSFTVPFKYVFVINGQCPKTGLSICRIAKARNDKMGVTIPVRLRGEVATFFDMSDKFELAGRRFRSIRADNQGVPIEHNEAQRA